MLISHRRFAISLLILAAGTASLADTGTPGAGPSEFVEVTATRVPEPPIAVPTAITVISGDELRARGATTLRDALLFVGGVDISPGRGSGPLSAVLELWGLREIDAFLLVVDGVPWGGAYNPDVVTLALADVDGEAEAAPAREAVELEEDRETPPAVPGGGAAVESIVTWARISFSTAGRRAALSAPARSIRRTSRSASTAAFTRWGVPPPLR